MNSVAAIDPEAGQQPASSTLPDWSKISEQIRCPLCEYDLRGLQEPRCPECGYSFHWEEILDRTRRRHKYLFEHHPEKSIRSFLATLVGGLFPWSFWRSLHPTQRPDLRRLWKYRSVILGLAWLPLLALMVLWVPRLTGGRRAPVMDVSFYQLAGRLFEGNPNYATVLIEPMLQTSLAKVVVLGTFLLLALPTLTAIPLSIFQATMRQAKVEHHHVQRCIIYSFDIVVWPGLTIMALAISMLFVPPRIGRIEAYALAWALLLMFPVVWVGMGVRLAFSCRYYLRLRHALAVVVGCEMIVFLLVVFLMMFVGELVINR